MHPVSSGLSRRSFLQTAGTAAAGLALSGALPLHAPGSARKRVALVGTGIRGISMWGKDLVEGYRDVLEFAGLCDINPGRVALARQYLGVSCPVFTDFDEMLRQTRPDTVIVTTVDATHHTFIIKALDFGADVITEKPLTTDEANCQAILDAERRSGRKLTVTFNYRYSPHRQKLYELLRAGEIGDIVSADFHWYLDVDHGASYFRRWHGLRDKSGTLLVHKASHHFDLLNWWLETEPEEVFAYGALEHYGRSHPFRHTHCRPCPHKAQCQFHWDITKDPYMMALYADHEHHDGYLRDGCLWREEIDIYDKMSAQIRYANGVHVSYSLTTYSPYEGYRIAFNGTRGRLEAWIQESQPWETPPYDELRLTHSFGESRLIQVSSQEAGHGGGDTRLRDRIFRAPDAPDPWRQAAGVRDGAMSVLTGIAARKSIETRQPVRIGSLTDLQPQARRP
jgi:predicted dehydrogenase